VLIIIITSIFATIYLKKKGITDRQDPNVELVNNYSTSNTSIGASSFASFPTISRTASEESSSTSVRKLAGSTSFKGSVLSGIEVKEMLGEGQFSCVYRGLWMGTEVALKKLKKDQGAEFWREAALLRCVSIVSVAHH
jgi:hypothetical protein